MNSWNSFACHAIRSVSVPNKITRKRIDDLARNHRVFGSARLDIEIKDRFGQPVVPHEWFLVPLFIIDEVVEKIRAGTISNFKYDPKSASLVEAAHREST